MNKQNMADANNLSLDLISELELVVNKYRPMPLAIVLGCLEIVKAAQIIASQAEYLRILTMRPSKPFSWR